MNDYDAPFKVGDRVKFAASPITTPVSLDKHYTVNSLALDDEDFWLIGLEEHPGVRFSETWFLLDGVDT